MTQWYCVGDTVEVTLLPHDPMIGKVIAMRQRPKGGHDCYVEFNNSGGSWFEATPSVLNVIVSIYPPRP